MLERCIVICIDCYFGGEENIMKQRKEKKTKQNKAEEQDRLSFPVFYFVSLREPVVKLCVRFCPAIQAEVTLKGKHGMLYIFHFLLF